MSFSPCYHIADEITVPKNAATDRRGAADPNHSLRCDGCLDRALADRSPFEFIFECSPWLVFGSVTGFLATWFEELLEAECQLEVKIVFPLASQSRGQLVDLCVLQH